MTTASALPFLQSPQSLPPVVVGNDASGTLSVPVYGGLTVAESALISDITADDPSSFVEASRIADAIAVSITTQRRSTDADAPAFTIVEAFNIIEAALNGATLEPEAEAIRLHHAAQVRQCGEVFKAGARRSSDALVLALLVCRLGLTLDAARAELQRPMHNALYNGLLGVAQREQDAEAMPSSPVTEEELGKPQPETGGAKRLRGTKSSTT